MPETTSLQIVVNGEPKSVPEGMNIEQLLTFLHIDPAHVAIEMNKAIVRRPAWSTTLVSENAELEIVQFVGGG